MAKNDIPFTEEEIAHITKLRKRQEQLERKNREKFLLTAVGKSGEWWVHVAD
jgi:hypothetical protein